MNMTDPFRDDELRSPPPPPTDARLKRRSEDRAIASHTTGRQVFHISSDSPAVEKSLQAPVVHVAVAEEDEASAASAVQPVGLRSQNTTETPKNPLR